jgi:hypothetical protein
MEGLTLSNVGESYWVAFPMANAAGPYKELHKVDKTKDKTRSSKIAWCIRLIWDRQSEYFNLEEHEKTELIFKDILGDVKYPVEHKELYGELRDFFVRTQTTVAKRTLSGIEDKLLERDKFIKATPYELGALTERGYVGGTVDTLDKMMANTYKLYELYDKARVLVDQENQQSNKGGVKTSLSDSGEI